MGTRHTIHTLKLNGASALTFSALVSGGHTINYGKVGPDSGGPYNEARFVASIENRIDATLEAIGTILDNLLINQVNCIASGETYTSLAMFGRSLDACGTDGTLAGSTHHSATAAIARLAVTQISASANGTAQATLAGYCLSADGVAAAVVAADDVALPTGGIVSEQFKLHGVQLANITLDSDKITSLTLDTGINVIPEFGVAQYPQAVTVTKTAPTLTIETEDTSLLSGSIFPETGKLATHANTVIEFQKRDATTGGFVAPATTEHISMTLAGMVTVDQPIQGSGSSKATARIVCECTGVAGTPPLTATVGGALTL